MMKDENLNVSADIDFLDIDHEQNIDSLFDISATVEDEKEEILFDNEGNESSPDPFDGW